MRAFSLHPSCPVAFSRSFRLGTHAYTREGPWFPSRASLYSLLLLTCATALLSRRISFSARGWSVGVRAAHVMHALGASRSVLAMWGVNRHGAKRKRVGGIAPTFDQRPIEAQIRASSVQQHVRHSKSSALDPQRRCDPLDRIQQVTTVTRFQNAFGGQISNNVAKTDNPTAQKDDEQPREQLRGTRGRRMAVSLTLVAV